jgi:CheY-like chemotaxis protein
MAKIGMEPSSESYTAILEAEKAAFRASRLTSQLLTFAKGGEPIKESQSIRDIVEDAVGFSLSGSNVDCQLSMPDDLWQLEIDRGQIDQVINNLIINAQQAMPGGGTIEVQAENVVIDDNASEGTSAYLPLSPGKYVRISIKDHGVGIPPENLDKIYDPYFSTKENGTGLGLTICYSILRKHNGLILAKSRVNYGTSFHMYLPASEKKKIVQQPEQPKKKLIGSGKVLVMDDEEVIRNTAGNILKIIGYTVAFAKDGLEAIELYKNAMAEGIPFDVVLMDLTIPGGVGGKDAIKKLHAIDPDVKAIVSSGYSNDPVMANYEKYGFCGVVSKPYLVDDLNRAIQNAMNS